MAALFACIVAGVRWAFGVTPFATLESLGWTLLAGAFEAVYFATLAKALTAGPLGAVYTVSRGGAVLVVWTAEEDTLPERFLQTPLPNDPAASLTRERLEELVSEYHRQRGW